MDSVTGLIAHSPERPANPRPRPHELAELIFAVARGMLMLDVSSPRK
jgi:hypothetical protein